VTEPMIIVKGTFIHDKMNTTDKFTIFWGQSKKLYIRLWFQYRYCVKMQNTG